MPTKIRLDLDSLQALEICTGLSTATWAALAELCDTASTAPQPVSDAAWAELKTLDWAEIDDADGIAATEEGAHALALARSLLAKLWALHEAETLAGVIPDAGGAGKRAEWL